MTNESTPLRPDQSDVAQGAEADPSPFSLGESFESSPIGPGEASSSERNQRKTSALRITLVDDETSVLFALKLLLEALGFSVSDFSDPEEALRHLRETCSADICLCDLRMPKLTGLQVLEQTRSFAPTLPFILMSAHASVAELQRARSLGASGVLTKPFTPDDLQAVIGALVVGGSPCEASPRSEDEPPAPEAAGTSDEEPA